MNPVILYVLFSSIVLLGLGLILYGLRQKSGKEDCPIECLPDSEHIRVEDRLTPVHLDFLETLDEPQNVPGAAPGENTPDSRITDDFTQLNERFEATKKIKVTDAQAQESSTEQPGDKPGKEKTLLEELGLESKRAQDAEPLKEEKDSEILVTPKPDDQKRVNFYIEASSPESVPADDEKPKASSDKGKEEA